MVILGVTCFTSAVRAGRSLSQGQQKLKLGSHLATEAETETVHPSSHFEVCGASSTEAEEATEEKGTFRYIRLRFRRAYSCTSVSVFMFHTRM